MIQREKLSVERELEWRQGVEPLGTRKNPLGIALEQGNQVRGAIRTCFNVDRTVLHDFHGLSV